MKHPFFGPMLALLIANSAFAQSNSMLSGQVRAQASQEAIPFASVAVMAADSIIVNGSIADEEGRFSILGLPNGSYRLYVTSIGYRKKEVPILIGELNRQYDVGKVELESEAITIEEVNIAGERSNIDAALSKKSFDMDDQIAQSGGSVMDAMKAMPSVNFDQDGKVILRGSDKVIVLIDGKPSSLTGYGNQTGLDNIPAANIERIEIINNPSAKYDANGMAGIINIVYKKEKQEGLNGNVGFSYGLGALTRAIADLPTDLGSYSPTPKYIPSLDLVLKKEKISLSLQSQAIFQRALPNNEFTIRTYDDGRTIASQVPENRQQQRYILQGGIDYQFSERSLLSLSGVFDWEKHTDTAQVPYINVSSGIRDRYIAWNEEEITGYLNYALQHNYKFRQAGHELTTRIQYVRGWEDETYFINDSSQVRSKGRDVTTVLGVEHIGSLQLDYSKPLRSGRIETGAKVQVRNLPVTYTQQRGENSILYSGLGEWSKWGETIYASYLTWIHERERYSFEAGTRAEYTQVFYEMDPSNAYYQRDDAYNYFKLFPNVRLSYKASEQHRFSLFYSYRVDRPGEPQLRMYSKSDDHELVKVGNPYLRPQFTQSVELGYKANWGSGSVFVAGYYRNIQDPYMRIYTRDTSNTDFDVVLKSYANTGEARNQGIEVVLSQRISPIWKLSGNFNYYQNHIFAYEGMLRFPYVHSFVVDESTEPTFDAKLINTFNLSQGLQIQLSALYIAAKNIPQGRELSRSSVDVGIKQSIWKGKGELSASISDLFNTYGIRQELTGDGFKALYENYYETRIVRVGMKYVF